MSRECIVSFRGAFPGASQQQEGDALRRPVEIKINSEQDALFVLALPRQVEVLSSALVQWDQEPVHFPEFT
jgi:hypothetical protein